MVLELQEECDLSISSDHRPSKSRSNVLSGSSQSQRQEYEQLLERVGSRLNKLNNDRFVVDFSSDNESSVFGGKWSDESRSSQSKFADD